MKPLLIILLISLPVLSTAQNQERYIKYLDAALTAAEKKDSVKVIENLEYFSTAIEVDNITPEKLERKVLDIYTEILYTFLFNGGTLPNKLAIMTIPFLEYNVNTKPYNMVVLGFLYNNGLGVIQNYEEAVKWYKKAAEQGYSIGQNNLGDMYYYGYGVSKNYEEAVKWYRKAAEQNNAPSQTNLGYMYKNGYGVSKNYEEAVKWYRKAADQDNSIAQSNLGHMYENGYGVTKSKQEARFWYEKACNNGHNIACDSLKKL